MVIRALSSGVLLALLTVTGSAMQLQQADEQEVLAAEAYAEERGISTEKAVHLLRLQNESGPLVARLRQEFSARLAGIFTQEDPDYRLVVRLAGQEPVKERLVSLPSGQIKVSFATNAPATKAQLLAVLKENMGQLRKIFPDMQGAGVDERTGKIVISIYSTKLARAAYEREGPATEKLLGHPVELEMQEMRERAP